VAEGTLRFTLARSGARFRRGSAVALLNQRGAASGRRAPSASASAPLPSSACRDAALPSVVRGTKSAHGRSSTAGIVQLVLGGAIELIAQAIHERWRSEQISAGKSAPSWDELDESRKESSRDQARDMPAKLHLVGCDIAPLREREPEDFAFTDDEVETLAAAEHLRWMQERVADGWTAGDKDVTRKTTPYLVPFEQLPADIAEYDRFYVREIPGLLALAGLEVARPRPRRGP
jgi:hypothetical protein